MLVSIVRSDFLDEDQAVTATVRGGVATLLIRSELITEDGVEALAEALRLLDERFPAVYQPPRLQLVRDDHTG